MMIILYSPVDSLDCCCWASWGGSGEAMVEGSGCEIFRTGGWGAGSATGTLGELSKRRCVEKLWFWKEMKGFRSEFMKFNQK